ncbi:MAG: hypothetical protein GY714_21585 [Desulfobacterales bacterium]|nr:hypothetical protein [Desulfobacterales bacterium]
MLNLKLLKELKTKKIFLIVLIVTLAVCFVSYIVYQVFLYDFKTVFKDYIFPLLTIFSGFGIAYYTIYRNEKGHTERKRIDVVNRLLFTISDAYHTLIAIKQNYHERFIDNPTADFEQRAVMVPFLPFNKAPVAFDLSPLVFIVPRENANSEKWDQLTLIETTINNYNGLIDHWKEHGELRKKLQQDYYDNNLQPDKTFLKELIFRTEYGIKLTDDLIIEVSDFLTNFPDLLKNKMDLKFGTTLTFNLKKNDNIHKRVPMNHTNLSKVLKIPLDEIKKMFTIYKT